MIKVLFICLGNICRSPLAEFYFKDLVAKHNLSAEFYIGYTATTPMGDRKRYIRNAKEAGGGKGISCAGKTARCMGKGGLPEIRLSDRDGSGEYPEYNTDRGR